MGQRNEWHSALQKGGKVYGRAGGSRPGGPESRSVAMMGPGSGGRWSGKAGPHLHSSAPESWAGSWGAEPSGASFPPSRCFHSQFHDLEPFPVALSVWQRGPVPSSHLLASCRPLGLLSHLPNTSSAQYLTGGCPSLAGVISGPAVSGPAPKHGQMTNPQHNATMDLAPFLQSWAPGAPPSSLFLAC